MSNHPRSGGKQQYSTTMKTRAFRDGMLDQSLDLGWNRTYADSTASDSWWYERGRMFAAATGISIFKLQNRRVPPELVQKYETLRRAKDIL